LVSPILDVFPGSKWRDHVIATWCYLQRNYHITENDSCSTHIHISVGRGYTLQELRAIASAVINFEPAFEALVPLHRRGNRWVKSNWLDSLNLAREGRSRTESIAEIQKAESKGDVICLMQRPDDKCFGWNFWTFFTKGTIEFRKPPASLKPADALGWAELVITFIQASMLYGSSSNLQSFTSTVGGLRSFLAQVNMPETNEPHRIQPIWAGTPLNAAVEPQ
jgi:Putative amidoligase enzyme